MKTLNKYCKANLINEYLSTTIKHTSSFPEELSYQNVEDWLTRNKFNYINTSDESAFTSIFDILNSHKEKAFTLGEYNPINEYTHWIAFKGYGEINKENPLFYLRTQHVSKIPYIIIYNYIDNNDLSKNDEKPFESYLEFRDEINKIFKI